MTFWCCAQFDKRHERWAFNCLALSGHVVYQPRIKLRRTESEPLFSNYIFVTVELQWHVIRWSPGILKLLMAGDEPARVPSRVIEELKARERNGLVVLPKPSRLNNNNGGAKFQIGDKVRVGVGPLSGFTGLVQNLKPHQRVEILLAALGRVELAQAAVELV